MMEIVNGIAVLPDSFHKNWIIEHGRLDHDVWLMKHLEEYVLAAFTVVDCGAHIGSHALWYSNRVGYHGRVFAFEANPNAFECLKYNCGGLKNVHLHNVALGSKTGTAGIVEVTDNYGMTYTTKEGNIPMISIDDVNLANCDFIKIDCEGAEPDILEGATKTIEKFRPTMLIEINVPALERNGYTVENIFEKLRTLRYSFRNIYKNEPMQGTQYDILCQSL